MRSYGRDDIRNVVLLSHGGAGKTSLSEAILFDAGVISRLGRVDDGNTTSDYDPDEVKRRISINLSPLPFSWQGFKINLIDTPGYADFVGEVVSGIRVADAAVVVVCAVSGVEVGTEIVWRYADERSLPRIVFVNKMDRDNANFPRVVEQLQNQFGRQCIPAQMPIGVAEGFRGIIDLLSMQALADEASSPGPIPGELADEAASLREGLIEAIAETNDELLMKYLEEEELTEEELRQGLRAATLAGQLIPVFAGSALQNKAIVPLVEAITLYLPSPGDGGAVIARNPNTQGEEALEPDSRGQLAALVFKTTADPFVGKLTYFRVYSGTLSSNSEVWNPTRGRSERIGQLFLVRGKAQEPVDAILSGDLGGVAKLTETATGHTLCQQEHPLLLEPIAYPPPAFTAAVSPRTKADVDKLSLALSRLAEEDPTLQVKKEPDTGETILSGIGESHVEIAADKMRRKFGVDVVVSTPKVSYKETPTMPIKAEYRHKKQTGGHGQYGHVFLELEPLPRGAGFEFAVRIVGGVIPKNYIPAVEKGVRAALVEGVLANYPVVDLRVTLYDGTFHSVDSSDFSFQIAGNMAFKKGLAQAKPVILEPIMLLQVTVPDAYMGDTIGALNSKRARVLGMTPEDGMSVIEAHVPQAELLRYATEVRSITQGRGFFTVEFSHYEEVPAHVAQKIIEEAKKEER